MFLFLWRRAEIVQKQTIVQMQTVPQSKLLICIMRKLRLIMKEPIKVFFLLPTVRALKQL